MQKSGGAAIPMQLNSELVRFRIGNEETIKQMPELSVDMPFAEGRIDFLNEISRELLKIRKQRNIQMSLHLPFGSEEQIWKKKRKNFFPTAVFG